MPIKRRGVVLFGPRGGGTPTFYWGSREPPGPRKNLVIEVLKMGDWKT